MGLSVVALAGVATLQDLGRSGWRHVGAPPGGAFDAWSLRAANRLVGNADGAAALELALASVTLSAERAVSVAVVGAPCRVVVEGRAVDVDHAIGMLMGSELSITIPEAGCRVYVAVAGGFQAAPVLGSVSGVLVGRGDELAVGLSDGVPGRARLSELPPSLGAGVLRCVAGPDASRLPDFDATVWQVSELLDRRGVRLEGRSVGPVATAVSRPACVGAIQLAGDGTPIVLGPDGPTIGGYRQWAVVISADLDKVGQLAPDDEVRLARVDLDEARAARERRFEGLPEP